MDPPVDKNKSKNPKKRPASSLAGPSKDTDAASNNNSSNRNKQRKLAQQTPTYSLSLPSSQQPNILRTIHPPRFAQSRAFELVALQSTLKRTLDLSKSRAFQKTPRYLRRRAASHNPRKVPRRLRDRAIRELQNDPVTPKKRKPKALRRKPRSDFLARQVRNGTWLETHLWMAKRFHMRAMFGFKVAVRPTQKGARSMYRAAKYASVVHDASYQSVYEFTGPQEHVAKLVQAVLDPAGPKVGAARYTGGKRSVSVQVFDISLTHRRSQLLGPATALWQPLDPSAMDTDTSAQPSRTLWLWTHPLIDERLLASLAHTMDSQSLTSVSVTQLTDLCKLSLVGPKSFGLLHSTLKLAPSMPAPQAAEWRSLAGLTDPSSLPAGAVLAVDVWDPRLSYPPARPTYARTEQQHRAAQDAVLHLSAASAPAAQSSVWSADTRLASRKGKARDHALNTRRQAHLVPGTRLTPLPDMDSSIPILLLATREGGLDLILPRGWSLPLWRTLVWAGARPAGLACMRSLAHEAGTPYFPWDYPTTPAYAGVVSDEAEERRRKWASRPSGKRVNYEKLMVERPFMPAWGEGKWLVSRAAAARVGEVRADVERVKEMVGREAFDDALVHVTLKFPGRGSAAEHALVYTLPDVQRAQWMRIIKQDAWDEAGDVNAGAFVDQTGEPREVVGYVTTGRFALSEGRTKVTAVVRLSEVVGKKAGWVLVRKTSGSVVYPAKVGWVHV